MLMVPVKILCLILFICCILTCSIYAILRSCISCLGLSQSKENCNNVCNNSISKYEKVEKFNLQSKECHQKDSEGCWIKFKLEQLTGEDKYSAEILKKKGMSLIVRLFFWFCFFTYLNNKLHC